MKIFAFLIVLISFSCSQKPTGTELFDHELLNLEYPNNWERLEEEGMILTISKFSMLESAVQEENPNLIIVAQDSINLLSYGITNYTDFLKGFKQNQLGKSNIELVEDFTVSNINETTLDVIKYKVQGEYLTFLQTQYFFSNLGQYVAIMLTHEFDNPDEELSKIIGTLKIPQYEPLEQLLNQN